MRDAKGFDNTDMVINLKGVLTKDISGIMHAASVCFYTIIFQLNVQLNRSFTEIWSLTVLTDSSVAGGVDTRVMDKETSLEAW